ncbi:MAG: PadR family transcriptional regulator [Chloroflexi bacterium]|jgi:DNA-binding PadR family transcriptional regulator|nr:PadR family transcriptional regulator [Chloroflexota bacterium]MBT3669014.1 PadR family transcriptional regulator [Chloroflexota bacterium]MBT4003615.1 PadR family transcriptional regulator [Chloroflexota bacterium]MBT4304985.1 PadR family transcriptional regulator [Chloroflexota bacterium]MBT4533252.1 PadR family transcriptional regulator [Chloroflexota bacterium]
MEKQIFLLGLIRQSDMHGYQILDLINSHFNIIINITKPTAYRLLNNMAEDGWISLREEKEGKRPPRHVYSITPKGEKEFQRMLRESLAEYKPIERPNPISIAFLQIFPPEEILPHMLKRKSSVESIIEGLIGTKDHQKNYQLVFEHQHFHLKAELKWINYTIEKMNSPDWGKDVK